MINDIISGMTNGIYDEFGSGYKIYTENIEQGLSEPCFFIVLLQAQQSRIIGNRFILSASFDVHYFPSTKAKNKEMQEVAQRLYPVLQRITLLDGDMLNGFEMNWEMVEDVLHFFVSYKPTLKYHEAIEEDMAELIVAAKTKGGE